jgi:hypothetical protein
MPLYTFQVLSDTPLLCGIAEGKDVKAVDHDRAPEKGTFWSGVNEGLQDWNI